MNEYNIFGAIVDSDMDKWSNDDITLSDFCAYLNELNDGDEVTFVFNSPGGSVATGVAMANKIRALKERGIKTTARVEGVCASIATCMMCACDDIVLSKGSFVMIHNCWTIVQGDYEKLRKEADLMEKMNEAILSFYRSKFNATDEQLKQWMDEETWISSEDARDFGLICEVDDNEVEFKIAASMKRYGFKNTPKRFIMTNEEDIVNADAQPMDVSTQVVEEPKVVEANAEPVVKDEEKTDEEQSEDEPTVEELKSKIEELEKENEELRKECEELRNECKDPKKKTSCEDEMVTKDECEKRVFGMQAKMQSQINDFQNQLKVRDEELRVARAELTRLNNELEKSTSELAEMTSALEEKKNALASLNAGVLKPSDGLPTFKEGLAKCRTPQQKLEYINSKNYKI